ncbi:MAG: cell division ATP-binding protein FtsE [bacterium]|nr:cell division ATP-binding protein FtsE [bacterium]
MALIKFKKISKNYPKKGFALEEVDFEITQGEFVSLIGRSGSGKTTIFRLLLGEEKPTHGKIYFKDIEVSKLDFEDLPFLRREVGMVFQDYKLLKSMTVYENIAYALEVIGTPEDRIKKEVPQVLEVVGLRERGDSFPDELSAGEKQRIAIARALVHRPELILADEPTGNLDPYHARDIIKLLLKINELGTTILLATHDKDLINILGKRVITLEKGKIIRDEEKGRFML